MDDRQPQSQAAAMMMPFAFPPMMQQVAQVLDSQAIPNVAPVRVSAAFDFITYMGHRLTPMVAVDNMGAIQKEDKPPLTAGERSAFDAACSCMTDYFNGALDVNELEAQRHVANGFELAKRCPGSVRSCPECLGRRENGVGVPCMTCRTAGKVVLVPIQEEDEPVHVAAAPKRQRRKKA